MSRGGILLAVALTLALSPAAAAGQAATQPDLMIVGRGGAFFVGDNLYNDDGVGQQRSLIVDQRTIFVIRVQNDGLGSDDIAVRGSPAVPGFTVRYLRGRSDVTDRLTDHGLLIRSIAPGATRDLRIVVEADADAPLGAVLQLLIKAAGTPSHDSDAVKVEVTKVSTPA